MYSIVVMSFKRKDNKIQYLQGHRSDGIYEDVRRLEIMNTKEESLHKFKARALLLKYSVKE